MKLGKKSKVAIITSVSVALFLVIACLVGFIVTGKSIGWGPFDYLKWNNIPQHVLSETEYSYTAEDKVIMCDGQKIRGTLFMPDNGKEKQEIVIVSHGYGQASNTNAYASKSFAKSGVCVFSFDYRGGANKSKSEGKSTDMSILTEKKDLNAVIDEVKTWNFVDTDKITIMGYSQGGLVAALTVSERNDINKLLLVFPAFSMQEEINGDYKSVDEVPNTVNRLGMKVGKIYFTDILTLDYDVYGQAVKYNGEVLIIHGTEDTAVPYSSSVKLSEMYHCELFTLEGAIHGFADTKYDLPFLQKAYEFFTK